jgi:hypothetical protein
MSEAAPEPRVMPRDLLRELNEALSREPTLAEIKKYGMDGSRSLIANNFNTLQWRLDLVRDIAAALAAVPSESDTTGAPNTSEDWDYVPRDMPLDDCIFECCIEPVDTDHDAHVLRHLRRNGWDVTRLAAVPSESPHTHTARCLDPVRREAACDVDDLNRILDRDAIPVQPADPR